MVAEAWLMVKPRAVVTIRLIPGWWLMIKPVCWLIPGWWLRACCWLEVIPG